MTTKASELVLMLQSAIKRYGDLDVETHDTDSPEVTLEENASGEPMGFFIESTYEDEE